MNPVEKIYGVIHDAARRAARPFVFQSNQATGTGKTYQALNTSGDALSQAQESGESLIVVYLAPQHGHIDIDNHFPHDVQRRLWGMGIPAVKVESQTLLTNPDEPKNLYRAILSREKRLKAAFTKAPGQRDRPPSLVKCLQSILHDHQKTSNTSHSLAEDCLEKLLADIAKHEKKLRDFRRLGYTEADLEKSLQMSREAHTKLFDLMLSAIKTVLKLSTRPSRQLTSVLGDDLLLAPFKFFQSLLFPWYDVVRHPGGPLGLVAMTAARLMTRHEFPLALIDEWRAGDGDFTTKKFYLEQVVHGRERDAGRVHGLKEDRTRFLFLIDEADAVKETIEEPAAASVQQSRMYLRGMLLDQARATQVGQVLMEQLPLVFSDKAYLDAVMADYSELFEQFPELEARRHLEKVADRERLPALSTSAAAAMRKLRMRHKLGSTDTTHHMQQVALRGRLLELLDQQYGQHPVIQGSREEKLMAFRARMEAFCRGVPLINLNLDDPTVAAAGGTGAFTAGSWAFINIDDQRMAGLLVHRDDDRAPDIQVISDGYLKEVGARAGNATFRLQDAFETMLSIAGLVHVMVNTPDKDGFAFLRHPFRSPNTTSSSPVTEMIKPLQKLRVRELMEARRPVYAEGEIGDEVAFRTPHLIMQLIPDFEDRYLLGEPGVSVVPAIGFRAWSAEHHIERLISQDAYRINAGDQAASPESHGCTDPQRPAHSAVLISATGGFEATHIGGFCGDMLAHSPYVAYHPMDEAALELAREARDTRQYGGEKSPGRPLPAIATIPEYEGLLAEDGRPGWLDEVEEVLDEVVLDHNPYKHRESRRVMELACLLGLPPSRVRASVMASGELHGALRYVIGEGVAPCMSLMLIQSLKTPLALLRRLSVLGEPRITEIIKGQLYGYWAGNRRHPARPVLIVCYRSGREGNTDASIGAMLRDEEASQKRRAVLADFLARSTGDVDLDALFPIKGSDEAPYPYTTTDLLRRDLECQVLVVSAYASAGMGLNFKVDIHLAGAERDLDLLVLGMSPHFTKARPKFERYKGPPGEEAPAETDSARGVRERQNGQSFKKNNAIVQGMAMTGIELAARLNHARWGDEGVWPAIRYRVKDMRLHPDSYLPSFRDFLYEQHVIDLARKVYQAVGRAERTQCAQQQALLVCSEIVADLLDADPILYGVDGHGRSSEAQMNSISLNSYALMRYVRGQRTSVFSYPTPGDMLEAELHLAQAHKAFAEDRRIDGWKNRQLQAIDAMNRGELSRDAAQALMACWEAWRDPSVLFEASRERNMRQAAVAGMPAEILSLMWLDLPANRYLPVVRDEHSSWCVALRAPEETCASHVMRYPQPDFQAQFRLPEGLLAKWQLALGAVEKWGAPSLRWSGCQVLHPGLQPDFKGIWGELAMDVWWHEARDHSALLSALEPVRGERLIGAYELFDRYHEAVQPGGEKVLLAIDAKHYARATDLRHGLNLLEDRQGKQRRVKAWALEKGYTRVVMVFLNTQPSPQEEARGGVRSREVLTLNAFLRVAPTDVNAPQDTRFGRDERRGVDSPLVVFNHAAARHLENVLREDA